MPIRATAMPPREQYLTGALPEAVASVSNAAPARITSGVVYNSGVADAYVQFHDLPAAPVGAEAPAAVLGIVKAGETFPLPCEAAGLTGAQLALSSTAATFTAYAFGHFIAWVVIRP